MFLYSLKSFVDQIRYLNSTLEFFSLLFLNLSSFLCFYSRTIWIAICMAVCLVRVASISSEPSHDLWWVSRLYYSCVWIWLFTHTVFILWDFSRLFYVLLIYHNILIEYGEQSNVYAIIFSKPPKRQHFIEFSKYFLHFSIHTKKYRFNQIKVILSIRIFENSLSLFKRRQKTKRHFWFMNDINFTFFLRVF